MKIILPQKAVAETFKVQNRCFGTGDKQTVQQSVYALFYSDMEPCKLQNAVKDFAEDGFPLTFHHQK